MLSYSTVTTIVRLMQIITSQERTLKRTANIHECIWCSALSSERKTDSSGGLHVTSTSGKVSLSWELKINVNITRTEPSKIAYIVSTSQLFRYY